MEENNQEVEEDSRAVEDNCYYNNCYSDYYMEQDQEGSIEVEDNNQDCNYYYYCKDKFGAEEDRKEYFPAVQVWNFLIFLQVLNYVVPLVPCN